MRLGLTYIQYIHWYYTWRVRKDLNYRTDALAAACCIPMSPPLSSRERSGESWGCHVAQIEYFNLETQ